MQPVEALLARWIKEADVLAKHRDERGSAMLRAHAAELGEALREVGRETLTLAQASRESGYSEDHLRHLVADGTVANAGERGRPRIRRSALPSKPKSARSSAAVDRILEAVR